MTGAGPRPRPSPASALVGFEEIRQEQRDGPPLDRPNPTIDQVPGSLPNRLGGWQLVHTVLDPEGTDGLWFVEVWWPFRLGLGTLTGA